MATPAITEKGIQKYDTGSSQSTNDFLAVEEPLEISLQATNAELRKVSITMRTPGNDLELAAGFLFTEGIVNAAADIGQILHTQTLPGVESNTLTVFLKENLEFDSGKLNRNFYTTSSCGVCGKASIDAIRSVGIYSGLTKNWTVAPGMLTQLPAKLRASQETFEKTGGLHASAIFDLGGNMLYLREDVGRHNALDKLIGATLLENKLPLDEHILLLSGRASFELLQKAAMAGIQFVAAVGAPSSLAVETAKDFGITLVGFLAEERFNIYCGAARLEESGTQDS